MKKPINIIELLIGRTVELARMEIKVGWTPKVTPEVTTEVTMEVAQQVANVRKSGINM